VLTEAQITAWHEDGWCVLPGLIPATDIAAAQPAIGHLFPTAEQMDASDDEANALWRTWDAAWPEFPFRSRSLNRIVVHDVLLDLAEQLLATTDLRLYMGLLSAKYANQSSGYNQLLHTDYPNHMVVVPRQDAGYQQLELFVYLSDVTTRNGATRMVSRRLTQSIPVERHTLGYADYPELYDTPGEASGPAGTVIAYRPDVYHRSVDITEPGQSRFMLHVSFKPANADWGGYQAWPFKGFAAEWTAFVGQATPRQLGLLGFPAPGHPYWTAETVAGVGARYPGLDTSPWSAAVQA
jgi:phytanoyl-CoA dioxygenase PhyH